MTPRQSASRRAPSAQSGRSPQSAFGADLNRNMDDAYLRADARSARGALPRSGSAPEAL